ncbi:MAG: c-type cytochrome [Pseudomonadales bacterium]|nr:c-type cytochrome [Pseudomonadales bacterium]
MSEVCQLKRVFLLSPNAIFVILPSPNQTRIRMMAKRFQFNFLKLLNVFLVCCGLLLGSQTFAQEVNPLERDPRAARVGGSLFRAQCATCHGADAKGIETIDAPDLTLMFTRDGVNDGSVFQVIRDGVPGSIMPPHSFTDTEVWTLVSYLRSVAVAGTTSPIDGDPRRGLTLFNENCALCHRVNGRGGSLGPDLSAITSRRSQTALVNSIRDPSANIGRRFKPVTLVTTANDLVQGTIKSEDAFSIQIMDSNQILRGFRKSALREVIHEETSLMPNFSDSDLSNSDIDDVLSFLQSNQ